jgi:hypothetical protein
MKHFTYQYVKTATLSEREAVLLIVIGRNGGTATALQAIKAAHEDTQLVPITHSEIYALAKRLEAKGLLVRGEDSVELHGEKLTRVVFKLTTAGVNCYGQAPPTKQAGSSGQIGNEVAIRHQLSSDTIRAGLTSQCELA